MASVFTLSIEAKTWLNSSQHHLAKHYKATDTTECRLKSQVTVPVSRPVRLYPVEITFEILPLPLDTRPVKSASVSPFHLLRAPPAPTFAAI